MNYADASSQGAIHFASRETKNLDATKAMRPVAPKAASLVATPSGCGDSGGGGGGRLFGQPTVPSGPWTGRTGGPSVLSRSPSAAQKPESDSPSFPATHPRVGLRMPSKSPCLKCLCRPSLPVIYHRANSAATETNFPIRANYDLRGIVYQRSKVMERAKGFEPSTSCLGSKHSTTELHPRSIAVRN